MNVVEIQEISLLDSHIESLHESLRELYERRSQIIKLPATDRHASEKRKELSTRTLRALDLSLESSPSRLKI